MAHLREIGVAILLLGSVALITFVSEGFIFKVVPYVSFLYRFYNGSDGYPYAFDGWCRNDSNFNIGPDSNYTFDGNWTINWPVSNCTPRNLTDYGAILDLNLAFYSVNNDYWRIPDHRRCMNVSRPFAIEWYKNKQEKGAEKACPCGLRKQLVSSAHIVLFYNYTNPCKKPFDWVYDVNQQYDKYTHVSLQQHLMLTLGEFFNGPFFEDFVRVVKYLYQGSEFFRNIVSSRYQKFEKNISLMYSNIRNLKFNFQLFDTKTPWWMFALFVSTKFLKEVLSILGIRSVTISYLPIGSTTILVSNLIWQVFSVSFGIEITYFNLLMFFSILVIFLIVIVFWVISVDRVEEFNIKVLNHKKSLTSNKFLLIFFMSVYKIMTLIVNMIAMAWCYSLIEGFVKFFDAFEAKHTISGKFIIVTFFLALFTLIVPGFIKYELRKSRRSQKFKALVHVLFLFLVAAIVIVYIYYFLIFTFLIDLTYFFTGMATYILTMTLLRKAFCTISEIVSSSLLYNIGDHDGIRFNALMRWMSSCAMSEIFSDFTRLMFLIVLMPSFSMVCLHLKWVTVMIVVVVVCLTTLVWQVLMNIEGLWISVSQHIKVKSYNHYDVRYCSRGLCPKLKQRQAFVFIENQFKCLLRTNENFVKLLTADGERQLKSEIENSKLLFQQELENCKFDFAAEKMNLEQKHRLEVQLQKSLSDIFIKCLDFALNVEKNEELEEEWPDLSVPTLRESVSRYFRYTLMLNLSRVRNGQNMRLDGDAIREIANEMNDVVPDEWKNNFDLMTYLFSNQWDANKERLRINNKLTPDQMMELENYRNLLTEKYEDRNYVVEEGVQAMRERYQRALANINTNVWLNFVKNVKNEVQTTAGEFVSRVPEPVEITNNPIENIVLEYNLGRGIMDEPFTTYFVSDIWASTEMEAGQEASREFLNQGLDVNFTGMYGEFSSEIAPGEWQIKMTDKKELHLTAKAFGVIEYLVNLVISYLGGLISKFSCLFNLFKGFFIGTYQSDLVKEFIEYLQTQNYFPVDDDRPLEDLLLNNCGIKEAAFNSKLNSSQKETFDMVRDLISINPVNYHKFRGLYATPSAKEILNAYTQILNQRRVGWEDSIEFTALGLEFVYSKILRPYISLPTKMPKQLKLYCHRQKIVMVPSNAKVPPNFLELESYNCRTEMCIVIDSLRNHYIAGHAVQTCFRLHNGQKCPATYRCYTYSGWRTLSKTGKIQFLFSNLNVENIVLVQENLNRTFVSQNGCMELRVPFNDLFYMTSIFGLGKFGILCSANVGGKAYLFTAAHVVAIRGDFKQEMGPGEWGETSVLSINPKAKEEAKKLSITGEIDIIQNGNVGTYFCPRWFRLKNALNQDFLGKVVSLDREGAIVDLYNLQKEKLELTSSLYVEKEDLHTQQKNSYMIRLDRNNEREVFPVVQPLYNFDSRNIVDYQYKSTHGDSGCPIIVGESLKGLNLGGFSDGTGGAFVGVTYDQNGVHYTSIKKLCGEMIDDTIYNSVELHDEKWRKREQSEPWSDDNETYYLEKVGDQWNMAVYSGNEFKKSKFGSTEDLREKIQNGDFEGKNLYLVERGQKFGDTDMKVEQKTWTDIIDNYMRETDRDAEMIMGHAEISMATYNEATNLMSEEEINGLLNKDLIDLVDYNSRLVVELKTLRDQLLKLKVARDMLEKNPEYKKQKKEYELAMLKFVDEKAEYESYMAEYKKLKDLRRKVIQEKTEEVGRIVKELKERKSKIVQESQKTFAELKSKQKSLTQQLAKVQETITETKSKKDVDSRLVDRLTKELSDLKRQVDAYKEEYRKKKMELTKAELGESNVSQVLIDKLKYFKDELQKLNVLKKTLSANTNAEVAEFNKRILEQNKILKQEHDKEKPVGKIPPIKPKFIEDLELATIKEHITKIGRLNKQGEKLRRVIEMIIKDNQNQTEISKLNQLANQSLGAFDHYYHKEDVYSIGDFLEFLDIDVRRKIANMLATSLWWELHESISRLEERKPSLVIDVDFADFVIDYFANCARAICEDFNIDEVRIDMEFGKENKLRNHSYLQNRTVMITPKLASVDAVQQNMLCGVQPCKVMCAYCQEVFACSQAHIGGTTQTLLDSACTMYCQRAVVNSFRGHLSDCKSNPSNSFSVTSPSMPQYLSCHHQSKIEGVNKCPIHSQSNQSCFSSSSREGYVSIVVNGETTFIDPVCLYAILHRMSVRHAVGECSASYTDGQVEKLKKGVSAKGKFKQGIFYNGISFDLSMLDNVAAAKFISNLDLISSSLPVANHTILDEQTDVLYLHAQKMTQFEGIIKELEMTNLELRNSIEKIVSVSNIDKGKFEERMARLEKGVLEQEKKKKEKEQKKEEKKLKEKKEEKVDEVEEELSNEEQENHMNVENDLPEKIIASPFLIHKGFKARPNYRGPKTEEIAGFFKNYIKKENTPFGMVSYIDRDDFKSIYSEMSPENKERLQNGLRVLNNQHFL